MFVSFLMPYPLRNTEAPYLWVFYKQLTAFSGEEVAYIGSEAYFADPERYREAGRYECGEETRRLLGYSLPSARELEELPRFIIEADVFGELEREHPSCNAVFSSLLTEVYPPLQYRLEAQLSEIAEKGEIEAVLTWCNCPSLNAAAQKFGLKVIHNELGPLRAPRYPMTAYFDFSGVNGRTESEVRLKCFMEEYRENPWTLLSRPELLTLLKEDFEPELPDYTRKVYDAGVALQVEDDSNILAFSKGWNALDLIAAAQKRFGKSEVLIRQHPGAHLGYAGVGEIDDSESAALFFGRCRSVVTINSSMGVEAALHGKRSFILGENPFTFLASGSLEEPEEIESPEEKLNFALLGYVIPFALLFDAGYYRWRLGRPSEEAIYRLHRSFYLERRGEMPEDADAVPFVRSLLLRQWQEYKTVHGRMIAAKESEIARKTEQFAQQQSELARQQSEIVRLEEARRTQEKEITGLRSQLSQREQEALYLAELAESMRLKKRVKRLLPFRKGRSAESKDLYEFARTNPLIRAVYHRAPLPQKLKWKIRQKLSAAGEAQTGRYNLDIGKLEYAGEPLTTVCPASGLPKVSVIIPCYNQGEYLWESVASAYASYSGELEIIVVDDGSTAPVTKKVLNEITQLYPELIIVRKANGGVSSARNEGLARAGGAYVQFLDGDDLLAPGKIDYQVMHLMNGGTDVSVTNYILSNFDLDHFYKLEETIRGIELNLENFLFKWERGLTVPIHSGLFRREIFEKVAFDRDSAKEDWVFWCDVLLDGRRMAFLDIDAVTYRVREDSRCRSFVQNAKEWETAYKKINEKVKARYPDFAEKSEAWLQQYYISHPAYRNELASVETGAAGTDSKPSAMMQDSEADDRCAARFSQWQQEGSGKPLISVIVPVFNHYEYLHACLESVAAQEGASVELICVDDCSSDERVPRLLSKIARSSDRVRIITHEGNKGISYTQNEAVDAAEGEFIAFLDCDDYLEADALETVARSIGKNPDTDYFFTDRTNIDSKGKKLYDALYKSVASGKGVKEDLLDRMIASHLKVIRRSVYRNVGGSNARLPGVQDWDLALKISEESDMLYIPQTLYRHRLHTASVTSTDAVAQEKKSNVLRRTFSEKRLRADRSEEYDRVLSELRKEIDPGSFAKHAPEGAALFTPKSLEIDSWYCPSALKKAYSEGRVCVMDMRGHVEKNYIQLVREFNSYFDLILCDRMDVASSVIGYLWSPDILISPIQWEQLLQYHGAAE